MQHIIPLLYLEQLYVINPTKYYTFLYTTPGPQKTAIYNLAYKLTDDSIRLNEMGVFSF